MRPLPILALVAACGGDGTDPQPETEDFSATLAAASVIGQSVVSDATGSAAFAYDGQSLAYSIDVQAIDQVIAAHIHGPASTAENAEIILTLYAPDAPSGTINGQLVAGSVGPSSPLLSPGITLDFVLGLLRLGNAYVLVHTSEYPDGEIRGQARP